MTKKKLAFEILKSMKILKKTHKNKRSENDKATASDCKSRNTRIGIRECDSGTRRGGGAAGMAERELGNLKPELRQQKYVSGKVGMQQRECESRNGRVRRREYESGERRNTKAGIKNPNAGARTQHRQLGNTRTETREWEQGNDREQDGNMRVGTHERESGNGIMG